MKKINKMDFYVGAFITSLLNNKTAKSVPALFDETNDSRRLLVDTDLGKFNLYIKYTSNPIDTKNGEKKCWRVPFSSMDMQKLENDNEYPGYNKLIILVLANKTLNDTKIAAIPYSDAMRLLASTTSTGVRRINVVRYGKEHRFTCYGASEKEVTGIKISFNHLSHFDTREKNKSEEEIMNN